MAETNKGAPSGKSSGSSSGYEVGRPLGKCSITGEPILAGQKFHAALRETVTGMERLDIREEAWGDFDKVGLLASWLTTMPTHEEKKKVFVDDEVLLTLFERLSETVEPVKVRFRFVLGLILMRKRLIMYESQRDDGNESIWTVKLRGRPEPMDLVNPHLSEELVGEVAGQLGEILNSEL